MKGIVVEIKGKYAVALTADGSFVKFRSRNDCEVGREVEFTPAVRWLDKSLLIRAASVAAVFVFAVGVSWGVYATPYSYVDVDINPSVELTTNIFDRIIGVEPLNPEGEIITNTLNLKHLRLEDGISQLLEEAVVTGYLQEGNADSVTLSVSGSNKEKAKQIEDKLKKTVEKELPQKGGATVNVIEKYSAEKQKEAREKGISPGKLSLIEKLVEQEPELNADELKSAPVKDIVKSLSKYRQDEKVQDDKGQDDKSNGNNLKGEKGQEKAAKKNKEKENEKDKDKENKEKEKVNKANRARDDVKDKDKDKDKDKAANTGGKSKASKKMINGNNAGNKGSSGNKGNKNNNVIYKKQ